MSLDDWRALGEDTSQRYELAQGVLIVSPRPRLRHQRVLSRLLVQLATRMPSGLESVSEPDVVLTDRPATVRVPDLVVCNSDQESILTAADVVVAVEILSPGSRRTDLVVKRGEYAAAGIEHYWIVDADAHRMLALTLVDGGYVGDWVDGMFTASSPFTVSLDLGEL